MSEYGLEVRDAEGNIIIDPSTFTVRQVAKKFISGNDLRLKTGQYSWTGAVQFPWADSKYGMFISVTQLGLAQLPPNPSAATLATITRTALGHPEEIDPDSLDAWINSTPRLPVATAYDGYIILAPAVHAFNADVWLSLYVVV